MHVFEHVVLLIQVYILHVPEDVALGLLGYVYQFQGTEEWLHLTFNATYLLGLCVLLRPLRRRVPQPLPLWAFTTFAVGAVGLESWHMVEHVVIISNVIQNNGCPCPGIGDAVLGISDTVLHFFYNSLTYAAVLVPFRYVWLAESGAAEAVMDSPGEARPDASVAPSAGNPANTGVTDGGEVHRVRDGFDVPAGEVDEDAGWRELDGGRVARLIHSLIAFALVAALGFGSGLSAGTYGEGQAASAVSVSAAVPVVVKGHPGVACAIWTDGAWSTKHCPWAYASGAAAVDAAVTPEPFSPACASLPDPAWKAQLSPSDQTGNHR